MEPFWGHVIEMSHCCKFAEGSNTGRVFRVLVKGICRHGQIDLEISSRQMNDTTTTLDKLL